jgi:CRISPR-associated protein Csb1
MVNSKAMRTDPLIKGEQLPLPEALRKARNEKKAKAADKEDKNNISAVGLGDILAKRFTGHVLVDYAIAKSTLSLAALRVYRFPIEGVRTPERDLAGRTVVAALALLTYELGWQRGFFLRSGCSLVPYGPHTRVIVGSDGVRRPLPGDVAGPSRIEAARNLYIAAVAAAAQHGLKFDDDRVLNANKSLNEVMAKSTRLEGVTPEDEAA